MISGPKPRGRPRKGLGKPPTEVGRPKKPRQKKLKISGPDTKAPSQKKKKGPVILRPWGTHVRVTKKRRVERTAPMVAMPKKLRLRGTEPPPTQQVLSSLKTQLDKNWLCLGAPIRAVLANHGIRSPQDVLGKDISFWTTLLKEEKKLKPWQTELKQLQVPQRGHLHQEDPEVDAWEAELPSRPVEGIPRRVIDITGGQYRGKERAGPTPSFNLQLLAQLQAEGYDVRQVLRKVILGKLATSIRDQSAVTYGSHEQSIRRFCKVMDEPVVPATREGVIMYSATIDHPDTLRGHLAAWKRLHMLALKPFSA